MRIYLDMDGTIANFYQGEWLKDIKQESTKPYEQATKLVSESKLKALINKGYSLGIISWLARGGSKEYGLRVRQAKKYWLKVNYPNIKFHEIHIVKWGTPKHNVANIKHQILIDDEKQNRDNWKGNAYKESVFQII